MTTYRCADANDLREAWARAVAGDEVQLSPGDYPMGDGPDFVRAGVSTRGLGNAQNTLIRYTGQLSLTQSANCCVHIAIARGEPVRTTQFRDFTLSVAPGRMLCAPIGVAEGGYASANTQRVTFDRVRVRGVSDALYFDDLWAEVTLSDCEISSNFDLMYCSGAVKITAVRTYFQCQLDYARSGYLAPTSSQFSGVSRARLAACTWDVRQVDEVPVESWDHMGIYTSSTQDTVITDTKMITNMPKLWSKFGDGRVLINQ